MGRTFAQVRGEDRVTIQAVAAAQLDQSQPCQRVAVAHLKDRWIYFVRGDAVMAAAGAENGLQPQREAEQALEMLLEVSEELEEMVKKVSSLSAIQNGDADPERCPWSNALRWAQSEQFDPMFEESTHKAPLEASLRAVVRAQRLSFAALQLIESNELLAADELTKAKQAAMEGVDTGDRLEQTLTYVSIVLQRLILENSK
ncbi:hypothetical protein CYMTET_8036 [Cymbomonas tetramitiformis]|uniref:Uncharacterized protein n=1 Tax=Cymbomonas tetramitiformis TaxID=36881 RepID=A0AAE0GTZ7_9CHLO|nr:hypothetical protein CYMTET_8036 [Cymbomonas tetramitiformis]